VNVFILSDNESLLARSFKETITYNWTKHCKQCHL